MLRHAVRQTAMRLIRAVLARPRVKRVARGLVARMPGLQGRVLGLVYRAATEPAADARRVRQARPEADLSPRTQRRYRELQRAMKKLER